MKVGFFYAARDMLGLIIISFGVARVLQFDARYVLRQSAQKAWPREALQRQVLGARQ